MEQVVTPQPSVLPIGTQWHSRQVRYEEGDWNTILGSLPEFKLAPFSIGPRENPFLRTVIRLPLNNREDPIPVGTVSPTYSLAPHREVATFCRQGLLDAGIPSDQLRYEVGLSEFDEWMNLYFYLPDDYGFDEQGEKLDLKLECVNSVDGSSSLTIMFGWHRLICSNGMVIRDTKIEIKKRHDRTLVLPSIPDRIRPAFEAIGADRERLMNWMDATVSIKNIKAWADNGLSMKWGKVAAARVFHICNSGQDIKIKSPFVTCPATEKPIEYLGRVPGSIAPAENKYNVSQALSFVATHRKNAEERVAWQEDIPHLLDHLSDATSPQRSFLH